ncbi:glycosyltransferase [Pseudoflavonifractor phocaeensis]|uniref:glycosyltransferase n=1 Tax=Pseudoflavonifractor phocaeensis TaxID=1870988 RepID=UPI00195AAB4E|nr:glycosyltransferase [Pseudoflavonifractor phocaeensis]MBM6885168.1 glycosyltransferase [Pseudoflavonifractor phocaeensis]
MSKVLFTASTYSHIVNFHRPYLAAFRQLGWTVEVACGGTPMEIPEAHRVVYIPFEKEMLSPRNMTAWRQLRRLMKEERYDLVSCHTSLASFFTRMAVRGLRNRPKVACVAHGYLFGEDTSAVKGMLLKGAERMAAPVTDLLMTMNHWDTQYAEAHQLGRQIVEVPGIGLDTGRLRPVSDEERAALRSEWGIAEGEILLLYAAEFSSRKSQQVLIRAMTRLPERVKLALPGQGALREACMALAAQLGVEERVLFPGQVQMAPWYGAADLAVSASRSEGLPFNIMEAMYCSLPVVASRVKGHTDLLEESGAGLLYPYGDWAACAGCIQELLQDPELADRMGERGRQAVEAYTLDRVQPMVIAQYGTLAPLGQPASAGSV